MGKKQRRLKPRGSSPASQLILECSVHVRPLLSAIAETMGEVAGPQLPDDQLGLPREGPAVATLTLRCKILMLGDSTVGKTSLAQVFQGGIQNFPKNYNMTIGSDLTIQKVTIPDTNVAVEMYIVDCGGFAVGQELSQPHFEDASAVMLVYDISSPTSFQNLEAWYDKVKESRVDSAFTGVVVAAKTDLADRPGAVTQEQGQQFASAKGLEYFEACGQKGMVQDPFHFLAYCYHQKYNERKADLANVT